MFVESLVVFLQTFEVFFQLVHLGFHHFALVDSDLSFQEGASCLFAELLDGYDHVVHPLTDLPTLSEDRQSGLFQSLVQSTDEFILHPHTALSAAD